MNENLTWKKIFSGKWLFTVVTALVFFYSVFTGMLNGEQVYGIIMLVIAFYFRKNEDQKNGH